jgi:hypothetical protein
MKEYLNIDKEPKITYGSQEINHDQPLGININPVVVQQKIDAGTIVAIIGVLLVGTWLERRWDEYRRPRRIDKALKKFLKKK